MRGEANQHGMRGWPRKKGEGDSLVVLLLAERARSEGARSTRAIEDQPGCPQRGRQASLEGWGGSGQVPFLLAERAR
jgi:hypothetical protein